MIITIILGWFLFCSYFTLVAVLIGGYDRGEWPYLIPFLLFGPVYFLPAWFIVRPILRKMKKHHPKEDEDYVKN